MAMATWLEAVPAATIPRLRADPTGFADTSGAHRWWTYHGPSLCWFVTGDAYPDPDDHPLGDLLGGPFVAHRALECGGFHVLDPERVAALAAGLAAVDRKAIAAAVRAADLASLIDEEELDDLEDLELEEAATEIVADLDGLTAFYAEAAARGDGVVSHTA